VKLAKRPVVVSGDIDDPGSAARPLEQGPEHLVLRLRPVHAALQAPEFDDVTNQIQRVALDAVEKVEEVLRAAASESKMDIRHRKQARTRRRVGGGIGLMRDSGDIDCVGRVGIAHDGRVTADGTCDDVQPVSCGSSRKPQERGDCGCGPEELSSIATA
jgi:hypothetical protein